MASQRTVPSSPGPRSSNDHAAGTQQPRSPKLRSREPPPVLFNYPSPAASNPSIHGPSTTILNTLYTGSLSSNAMSSSIASGSRPNPAMSLSADMMSGRVPFRTADSSRSVDRTDALWAEMQATLEEVEVSASGGTTIFGPEHDRKLAQLRTAQIALAQAWARSEADDAIETRAGGSSVTAGVAGGGGNINGSAGDELLPLTRSVGAEQPTKDAKSVNGGSNTIPRSGSSGRTADRLGARLEEETKADILLARRRREANDQYFQRVSSGVLDVVAKLEDVAKAMAEVERENKSVWNDEPDVGPPKP